MMLQTRHCERSEAIQRIDFNWIASFLAMTVVALILHLQ